MRKATWAGTAAAFWLLALTAGASATAEHRVALAPGGQLGIRGPIVREDCESRKGWACRRIIPEAKPFAEEGTAFGAVDKLKFVFGAELLTEQGAGVDTQETVRFTLPPGLAWAGPGRAVPPSGWSFAPLFERCTQAGQVATCEVGVPWNGSGTFAWLFDVTAKKSGYYALQVEIGNRAANKPPRENTPELVRLKTLVRDGGDAVPGPVTSKPYLLNARLGKRLHGLRVLALVWKGGLPVRPGTNPRCTASIGRKRLVGDDEPATGFSPGHFWTWRVRGVYLDAGYGWAFCDIYLSPPLLKKYAGQRLRGTISFRVGKTKVTRAYAARIVAHGPWIAHPPPPP